MKFRLNFFKKSKLNLFHNLTKKKKRQLLRSSFQAAIFLILFGVLFVGLAFAWYAKDLPTPSKITSRKATESTKIYDRTGQTLLYETGEQKRTVVADDQISKYLKDATVSTEDANFYKHHGFDTRAIFTALGEKLIGKVRRTRGGSTITQQYVKTSFLTTDRSLVRKFKELILSIELEFMFSKDQILTMYLNEIPYGNGTAGAEAASVMYFGKPAKDLTLAEAATLAGIPQAPSYYSPYGTHIKELVRRKNYVLDRMVETGKVSKEDAEKAKSEDTTTLGQDLKPRRNSFLAPHFSMYIVDQIIKQYGEDKIQKEGLKIITTLDYTKQQQAETAIAEGSAKLDRYGATNAALVATDPKTGEILAMVGSRDYYNTDIDGNVNVTDSLRQPGSSFKPFAYATAFKQPEYSPSKILFDLETDFGKYVPKNYNGHNNGPVTMRQALSNSLNVPAVKVMSLAGIDNVLRTASDMGITTLTHRDQYGLSLVLGAGEVKPVEMSNAFSVFATQGIHHDLKSIIKVTDSSGKILSEYKSEEDAGTRALDSQIAYEIASILSDNNARALVFGTHSSLAFDNRTVAAKTGTTSDFKDAWTVGFTPSISVAVWVGNSDSTVMKSGADGSIVAAPIFHNFINKTLEGTPNEEFAKPEGIQEITVEKYSNKLPSSASKELVTDIFAAWQVPTDQDNIHKIVKVCKTNGQLAPADLPESLREEKVFTKISSERPDNPNWEGPVGAWAEQNGMSENPPTEYCYAKSLLPAVIISQPKENSTLSGENAIAATPTSSSGIKSAEFFIDGISIGTSTSSPYSKTYNFNNLATGSHKIAVVATDQNDITARSEISVSTTNDRGITISDITYAIAASTPGKKVLTINWKTDLPATSQVIVKSIDGTINKESEILTRKDITHSSSLDLIAGVRYNLTIISKDDDGHETTAQKQTEPL